VYARQLLGFESEKHPHRVYKLRKVLYGGVQVEEGVVWVEAGAKSLVW
jgi:hypothetical protein